MDSKKQNGNATKKDLQEFGDAILSGMQEMFDQQDKRFDNVEGRLDNLEQNVSELKMDMRQVKDDMKGIKAEFSDTPTKREFSELRERVDKYHPQA